MFTKLRFSVAALAALFSISAMSAPAWASGASAGTISSIHGTKNGAVLFYTSGTRTGPMPSCSPASLVQRFALDASTVAGQAQAAILMTAWTQGKSVVIAGTGTCTIWGDTETVSYFLVVD